MIKFIALEKIIDRLQLILRVNNHNKRIVNKNSPNYGTQNIADTIINKTGLTHKSLDDIRKLDIINIAPREYKVKATHSDGTKDNQFKGHWYGWQIIGGTKAVWTPFGKKNSINLGQSQFSEISVWVREQSDDQDVDRNVYSSIGVEVQK